MATPISALNRRNFLNVTARAGLASTLFPGVLWAMADEKKAPVVTRDMIDQAAKIADVSIADEYKEMMLEDLNSAVEDYDTIHKLSLANSVQPAVHFNPILPGMKIAVTKKPIRISAAPIVRAPKDIEDVAFYSVRQLAELVHSRRVSSLSLTQMYLERLKRYDPLLKFVITLTEDRALAQAREADREIAAGKYRGPLHGLPWGAKDLLAVKGYPTTWGAGGFEKQSFDEDAEVVKRLDHAGAVLIAKLTLGALAMGDVWFGGTTQNPWKIGQGSSGSSAGSASATSAGCIAFGIGTETLGSIASPSTRCGVTGLRPTFGRVPRTGGMALTWSMDKIGPICRAVEDCALVMAAINGPDHKDASVHDLPWNWDATFDPKSLRIGYLKTDFENEPKAQDDDNEEKKTARARRLEQKKFDDAALAVMRDKLGWKLTPVKMPDVPYGSMLSILNAEAAAAFDELTRSGRDKLLTAQKKNDWPNSFRVARFIPAVEYVNANRARTLGMQAMAALFNDVDVIVAPTFGSTQLVATNLTGHPACILPNGFRASDGTPVSITFFGNLFREDQLLTAARAYQNATDFHLKHPDLKAPESDKAKPTK
jgi:Asp-tRNA(Asn)/Glu-tRNA(Gln) amidotransferase A subunit family amidase